jgi:predicted phage terminase large subunit-like protein
MNSPLRSFENELLNRVNAKNSLPAFIDYLCLGYKFAAHHSLLMRELEAVERGEVDRLMVLMPPGSAKSTYASVLFPPWFLGRNQQAAVLGVSNTTDLAERFSRRVRNLVALREYQNVFSGNGISQDSAAAGNWETILGGEFFAAGMGSAIAGRRADLGLIDDPIKTRQEADSDRIRQTQWDWYVNDFLTRLKPGARQILIQTRWHEDDLGGRILEREADRWRVVKIPMLAVNDSDVLGRKAGERLWPEWFTDEMIATARADTRSWNALYQQEPVPDEGDFFRKDNFSNYETYPEGLHVYCASDFAVTDGAGDFTEHGVFGIDQQGNMFVLDWWRGQAASDVWIEAMCDLIKQWQPLVWFGEAGPIRRAIEPFLVKRMAERKAFCRLEWLPSIHDKEIRARAIQAFASIKAIMLPKHGASWRADVEKQLLQFPAGKYDDAVDVFGLIGRGLEHVQPARRPRPRLVDDAPAGWMS